MLLNLLLLAGELTGAAATAAALLVVTVVVVTLDVVLGHVFSHVAELKMKEGKRVVLEKFENIND